MHHLHLAGLIYLRNCSIKVWLTRFQNRHLLKQRKCQTFLCLCRKHFEQQETKMRVGPQLSIWDSEVDAQFSFSCRGLFLPFGFLDATCSFEPRRWGQTIGLSAARLTTNKPVRNLSNSSPCSFKLGVLSSAKIPV